MDTIMLN